MKEQDQYQTALTAAEAAYTLWELSVQQGVLDPNLDRLMQRFKDLSTYSLTHADIAERREIVELLALGMFFGVSSEERFAPNQQRLHQLSQETIDYQGQAENIEKEIADRGRRRTRDDTPDGDSFQYRLF